jgi:DNA integrity scanning protein DisA with diadenylate cyclase activity
MKLEDVWENLIDGESEIDVAPINNIAQAVIELEKNGHTGQMDVDTEMSDVSENPVQNKVIKAYVDDKVGDISAALDELHAYAEALKGGEA